eukprot:14240-Rhodomonas_salina.1
MRLLIRYGMCDTDAGYLLRDFAVLALRYFAVLTVRMWYQSIDYVAKHGGSAGYHVESAAEKKKRGYLTRFQVANTPGLTKFREKVRSETVSAGFGGGSLWADGRGCS